MNYIGSKYRLADFICSEILKTVGKTEDKILAELFGGTGIISRKLKSKVGKIIVNDIEPYSYSLLRNYIGNHLPFDYSPLLEKLNRLEGTEGFIYRHYCKGSGSGRQYFSDENGKKADAIRMQINHWRKEGKINDDEYYFLLASLLESVDKVANTASVYGAFLKHLKKSAQKPLVLLPAGFETNSSEHEVYNMNANLLIRKIKGDILYLDPPYNARQYGANYHLLNTLALYDEFIPSGKTGMRTYNKSEYCSKSKVQSAFEQLVAEADFKFIFLSYNNEGLMNCQEVKKIMEQYGSYKLSTTKYQRFKADKDENRKHKAQSTTEYLHILIKN